LLLKGLRRESSEAGEVERSGSWVRRDQPIWLRDERKADSEEADMVARESGEVKMGDVVWSDGRDQSMEILLEISSHTTISTDTVTVISSLPYDSEARKAFFSKTGAVAKYGRQSMQLAYRFTQRVTNCLRKILLGNTKHDFSTKC
jgi:hypothetical protein